MMPINIIPTISNRYNRVPAVLVTSSVALCEIEKGISDGESAFGPPSNITEGYEGYILGIPVWIDERFDEPAFFSHPAQISVESE
jgi:hypothetical protein